MIALFVDPTISSPSVLTDLISVIRQRSPAHVVCFFNTHQAEFLKSNGVSVICYSTQEWPMHARNSTMEKILQGFNDWQDKPWSTCSLEVDGRDYALNVFQFLSGNFFLKGLYLPVAKTLFLYLQAHKLSGAIVFGSEIFCHHVEFLLKKQEHSIIPEIKHTPVKRSTGIFTNLFGTIFALVKLLKWVFLRVVFHRNFILIPHGKITDPIVLRLKKQIGIIHSINRLIPIFRPRRAGRDISAIQAVFTKTLVLEKSGKEPVIQLAFEIFINFLSRGYLDRRIRENVAIIRILNIIRPRTIIQLNLSGELNPFQIWASKFKRPTVCIQHGIQGKFSFDVKYDIESDYYYAWAPLKFDHARTDGKVKIMGNPLYSLPIPKHKQAMPPITNVLIAPTALPYYKSDADYEFWSKLLPYLASKHFKVIIKFHHKDRFKGMVVNQLSSSGIQLELFSGNLETAFEQSDLVITTVSTVALDAFRYEKPVIILNNAYESEFFTKYHGGKVLFNMEDLKVELEKLSDDPTYYTARITSQLHFYSMFCSAFSDQQMADEIRSIAGSEN